jgi:hypothetical protein
VNVTILRWPILEFRERSDGTKETIRVAKPTRELRGTYLGKHGQRCFVKMGMAGEREFWLRDGSATRQEMRDYVIAPHDLEAIRELDGREKHK